MSNETETRKPFNTRGLFSLIVLWTSVIMAVSSIVLYLVPGGPPGQGGASSWLNKGDWKAMHIITAFAFVIAVAFHVYFNWSTLVNHLKSKATHHFRLSRELIVATVFTVLLVLGTLAGVPPAQYHRRGIWTSWRKPWPGWEI